MGKSKSLATQSSVKLKEGSTKRVRWFNPTDSVFTGLDLMAKVNDIQLQMGTEKIDMVVPFGWYPKAQYAGTHVLACVKCSCDADGASRIPANRYSTRQVAKVTKLCGLW